MKVVRFTKARYFMFALSIAFVVCGLIVTIFVNKGFNLGVDFNPGANVYISVEGDNVSIDDIRASLVGYSSKVTKGANDTSFTVYVQEKALKGDEKDNLDNLSELEKLAYKASESDGDFAQVASDKVVEVVGAVNGIDKVVVEKKEGISARYSELLAGSSVSLVIVALLLITIYIWIRFKFSFAVASMVALMHDILVMFAFIGIFQVEITVTTIAAILTIIGYSLNDTIVIFDRIRENLKIIKSKSKKVVVDTSITQSLSRTIITSLTTLLAVLSLFFIATGDIKNFALNLIIGIVVGTYSSIFIASPVFLGISSWGEKIKIKKEKKKYGNKVVNTVKDNTVSDDEEVVIPRIERKPKKKKKK